MPSIPYISSIPATFQYLFFLNDLEDMQFQAEAFAMYWGIVEVDYGESFDDLDTALQAEII